MLPLVAQWTPPVLLPAVVGQENSAAPEILAELSSDLTSIAIALLVGCVILVRDTRSKAISRSTWFVLAFTIAAAIASCYAGFRFRFAIAEQILLIPLDINRIGDRLATQGLMLLLSLSGMLYFATYLLTHTSSTDNSVGKE